MRTVLFRFKGQRIDAGATVRILSKDFDKVMTIGGKKRTPGPSQAPARAVRQARLRNASCTGSATGSTDGFFCLAASSISSYHIAFSTPNAAASGSPNNQAKYHMIGFLSFFD